MKISPRKFWASIAVSLIAVVAMGWMLRNVSWDIAIAAWQAVPIYVWCLSAIGLVLSHVLRAGRIRAEWHETLNMKWREAWGLMVRHSAWVVLIPMRGGEAIYVWVLHRQGGVSIRAASISLIKLRIQDMAVLGCLALAVFAPISTMQSVLLGLALIAFAIWILPLVWHWLLHHFLMKKGETPFQAPAPAIESWLYAVSNWIVKACAIAWPMWIMLPVDFRTALHGAIGGELAATLPMQPPAGFGPYEAGVIFGVQWIGGIPWSHIAAAALAVHLLALGVTTGSAALAYLLGWSRSELRRCDDQQNTLSTDQPSPDVY